MNDNVIVNKNKPLSASKLHTTPHPKKPVSRNQIKREFGNEPLSKKCSIPKHLKKLDGRRDNFSTGKKKRVKPIEGGEPDWSIVLPRFPESLV